MRGVCLISLLILSISDLSQNGQESVSKSEKSFSKIKVKKGTRNVILPNDYNKRWKVRVAFPEETQEKNSLIIAFHWADDGNSYKEFNDCLVLPGLEDLNAIIVSPEDETNCGQRAMM